MERWWGLCGLVVIFGTAYLLSSDRTAIRWRTIIGAFVIQVCFATIVLKWEWGKQLFSHLSTGVQLLIESSNKGIQFLFGGVLAAKGVTFVFAFQVLTIIIFFSSFIAVLYHLGMMQWIIRIIGGGLARLLGTTQAESVSAAANIFVGQTEAPLVIKPYLAAMTRSELFAVMVGGLASVSGSVLAGYHLMGVPLEYLLAASFMAAPAGLCMAKLLLPETIHPTNTKPITFDRDRSVSNVLDAAAIGASQGLQLAANVGAMLLAFISLIALVNLLLGEAGNLVGLTGLSLEKLLGYLFAPIAFVIGVPQHEALQAGSLLGQKMILNEFVAFAHFGPLIPQLTDKTVTIVSFALCGFANFSSIAILLGGLGGMAPARRGEISQLGIRAIVAGTLANLSNAAIAGMFM